MVMSNPFMPRFEELPDDKLPVFPLPGAIVLPNCDLHLNIFEPRYLNMINDALTAHRLIGMVQPVDADAGEDVGALDIHSTGTAGRITSYQETNDGRILIVLTGVCRFDIGVEHALRNGYRSVQPDWTPYRVDLHPDDDHVDVGVVMTAIERYLGDNELQANVDSLKKLAPDMLINTLSMHMPFSPVDKQALIEADNIAARAALLVALCRFGSSDTDQNPGTRH